MHHRNLSAIYLVQNVFFRVKLADYDNRTPIPIRQAAENNLLCTVEKQAQTGIRQNLKHLFLAEARSHVIRIAKAQKHKAESLSLIVIVSRYQKFMQTRQTRARENQKRNQRGVE